MGKQHRCIRGSEASKRKLWRFGDLAAEVLNKSVCQHSKSMISLVFFSRSSQTAREVVKKSEPHQKNADVLAFLFIFVYRNLESLLKVRMYQRFRSVLLMNEKVI